MVKIKKILLVLFFLLLFYGCRQKPTVEINGINIEVELAETNKERSQGLMYRETLDEMSGMLFVFNEESYKSFWMKNTIIPLDIIFINPSNKIIDVTTMQPCKIDNCESYTSKEKAIYVLEVNAGFAEKFNISEGDTVKISI